MWRDAATESSCRSVQGTQESSRPFITARWRSFSVQRPNTPDYAAGDRSPRKQGAGGRHIDLYVVCRKFDDLKVSCEVIVRIDDVLGRRNVDHQSQRVAVQ